MAGQKENIRFNGLMAESDMDPWQDLHLLFKLSCFSFLSTFPIAKSAMLGSENC